MTRPVRVGVMLAAGSLGYLMYARARWSRGTAERVEAKLDAVKGGVDHLVARWEAIE